MQARLSHSRKRMLTQGSWRTTGSLFLALALVVAAPGHALFAFAQEKAEKPAGKSLYKRLGGYDEIASIVDDFLGRMAKDPQFARFGTGRSVASKQRARQLIVDQLCALTGGPCVYIGRDMQTSHQGLGITENEWEASGKYMAETLEKHGIPQKEQQELAAIIAELRADIVEKPKK